MSDAKDTESSITEVILSKVKPGQTEAYRAWAIRIQAAQPDEATGVDGAKKSQTRKQASRRYDEGGFTFRIQTTLPTVKHLLEGGAGPSTAARGSLVMIGNP